MKYYGVCYYDGAGSMTSVIIPARNEKSARNKFIHYYGYYTIIMLKEVNLWTKNS